MLRLLILAAGLTAISTPVAAKADEDSQYWATLTANTPISGPFLLGLELTARASDDQGRIYEFERIIDVGYKLSSRVTLWAGVNAQLNFRGPAGTQDEIRGRQRINWAIAKRLASRTLLEERFREGSDEVGVRIRQQLKYSLPLKKDGKIGVFAAHESYFDFNQTSWGQRGGYERMRNSAGLSFQPAKAIKAELSYLNQYDFRRNADDRMAHAVLLSIGLSL